MQTAHGSNRLFTLLLGIVVFALAGFAYADPPMRVARLGYVTGPVSFSPAGEDAWVEATLNRPLVTGDRLWADAGARVELQIGSAVIRLGAATSVTLLNLDDRVAQFQLAQGTLNVRVRRLDANQVVEIDTPNLAYVINRPGQYRVSVDPNGDATEVRTSNGRAEVYGDGASYVVDAGRAYRFYGSGLGDYEDLAFPGSDEFDRWAQDRDRSYDSSTSARYVSRDVIGYQDLDAYGTWRSVPEYGNVWMPTRVSADWAPYRDGHWAWVDPWGWTWVDDAPWGFAVSHYGRWASVRGSWGWIPGPVAARAVYAPALVAFIGGNNFGISISSGGGAVGWFPLGPRDVYRPAYPVSRAYFTNVNVSNTVINNTNITNVYNNPSVTNVTYVNQQVPGAVVAVPATAFVQSQPVARAALRVQHDAVNRAPVTTVAAVAPVQVSVQGAAPQGAKPPQQVLDRRAVVKSVPPAAPVRFADKERALSANPGKPIEPSALAAMKPATPAAAPKVEVVTPSRKAGPVAAPPPQAAEAKGRGKRDRQAQPQPTAPVAQPQPAAPQPPTAAQPMQRDAPSPAQGTAKAPAEAGGRADARKQANEPAPVTAPQDQRSRGEARKQANEPAPVAAPQDQRSRGEARKQANEPAPVAAPQDQRSKGEARKQANEPAPVVAPPVVARPPQADAPAPVQAPPEQRNKREARGQPNAPAPVAAPPVQRAVPEQPRARPEPPAAAKPMPSAPVARPPEPAQAGAPPPKGEQAGKEPPPAGDRKRDKKRDKNADDPAKGDDEPKRK